MKIETIDHAVRVLKYLAKHGVQSAIVLLPQQSWVFVYALVDGAKAALKEYKRMEKNNTMGKVCAGYILIELAQAYAPRMAEAGMEVPQ